MLKRLLDILVDFVKSLGECFFSSVENLIFQIKFDLFDKSDYGADFNYADDVEEEDLEVEEKPKKKKKKKSKK